MCDEERPQRTERESASFPTDATQTAMGSVSGAAAGAAALASAAAMGALAGMLAGPAGAVVGGILGAALGGAAGELVHTALDQPRPTSVEQSTADQQD